MKDLNHDLAIINQWAYLWIMSFSPDCNKQATELLFSCKKKAIDHPDLVFTGSTVLRVNDHKHLCLVLQPNSSFEKHLYEKISIAKKNIGII